MNKIIFFQKCSINNIYFLFFLLTSLIEIIIKYNNEVFRSHIDNQSNFSYYFSYRILNLYLSIICDFLMIIPFFIRKKILNRNKVNEKVEIKNSGINSFEKTETNQLIYNNTIIEHSNKRKKLIIINAIIIGTLDFFNIFSLMTYNIIFPSKLTYIYNFNSTIPLSIIFQFISSYLIFKTNFYKLQYFSLFLNTIVFIIIFIIDLINIIYNNSFDGYFLLFYSLSLIILSVEYAFSKKILLYGYISIYLLLVMRGFIKFILSIILSLIILLIKKEIFIDIGIFLKGTKNILFFFLNIFTYFFEVIFLWLIIDRFSPNYTPFALILKHISDYTIETIYDPEINFTNIMGWDIYFRIFLCIISFIGVLLHNQIIIINICGLGSDTKYFLDLKVESEQLYSDTEDPEILKRFETAIEFGDKSEKSEDDSIIV